MERPRPVGRKPHLIWRSFFNNSAYSIFLQRTILDSMARTLGKTPKAARVKKARLAGLKAEIIEGWAHADGRTLLYLHGGAYMMGSIATHRPMASVFSRLSQARGVVIDYRLAPEHPFPAALEDALAAYRGLLSSGVPSFKLAVAGDSAGGGLTLALLLALRDAGDPLPACALVMSPWTDLAQCNKSRFYKETGRRDKMDYFLRYMARMYVGQSDACNPYISPAMGDFTGLPPLLIQAARGELLRHDARTVARKARENGVDVRVNFYDSKTHVLQGFAGRSDLGRSLIREGGEFLLSHLEK